MLPLPKHGFLSYFGRRQGSLLANVTPGKGLRGFLLPSTATRDQEPITEDNEARGEDGGRGHVLDQLSALLHMRTNPSSGPMLPPFLGPSYCMLMDLGWLGPLAAGSLPSCVDTGNSAPTVS